VSAKYEFIDAEKASYPVLKMCAWLGVSRSGFYEWASRAESATARRRQELCLMITEAFEHSDSTYGHRRVHAQLARWGVRASLELVRALMRALDLRPCQPRPWRPVTTVAGDAGAVPDLVRRDFTAPAPGLKFIGDITYIRTWEGFIYLATVIDCYTKECVGYAMADHLRTELVTDALDMAARNNRFTPGAIFHSDRGSQYMSEWRASRIPDSGPIRVHSGMEVAECRAIAGVSLLNSRMKPLGWSSSRLVPSLM
jgi:transposase InsO family protein